MPCSIRGYSEKDPTSGLKPPGMKEALGPNMEAMIVVLDCLSKPIDFGFNLNEPKINCVIIFINLNTKDGSQTQGLLACIFSDCC